MTNEELEARVVALEKVNADYLIRIDNLADYRVRTTKALYEYTYESPQASLRSCLKLIEVFKELMSKVVDSQLKNATWKLGEAVDQFATRQTAIAIKMGKIMSDKHVY